MSNIRAVLGLEYESKYSSRVIDALVVCLFYLVLSPFMDRLRFGAKGTTDPVPDTTAIAIESSEYLNELITNSLTSSLGALRFMLIFIIPLLIASTLARGLEDGTIRTYLSYPIGRSLLLALRTFTPIIIVGLPATIAFSLGSWARFSSTLPIDRFLWAIMGMWTFIILVTSVTTLIAILSKDTAITSIVGAGLCYINSIIAYDTAIQLIGAFVLAAIALVISQLLFRSLEA